MTKSYALTRSLYGTDSKHSRTTRLSDVKQVSPEYLERLESFEGQGLVKAAILEHINQTLQSFVLEIENEEESYENEMT